MKKTELTLFICTILFCTPAVSISIDETDSSSVLKIKSSHKQVKPFIETPPGWYSSNNRIKIKYTEAKEIGSFEGGKLYGYVDPSFTDSRWEMVLGKGFTKTAKGANGIKFINNSILELKINEDARIYTNEIHKNDQGDYIAIFNRQADHKKIKKLVNKNNFKIYTDCFSRLRSKRDGRGDYELHN